MRIGIACYASIGGSGALATELGKELALRGHEIHFISSGTPFRLGEFRQNVFLHEVETAQHDVFRQPPFELALACKMADIIQTYSLDILHVHFAVPFAVCAFLAKEMCPGHPVQVVTTLHGTDITVLAQDLSLREAIRLGIEKSSAVTAVSESLAHDTRLLFDTAAEIRTIYNFVNTSRYQRLNMDKVRLNYAPAGEPILVHVSNFRTVKRVPDVIKVFAGVRKERPVKLLLVGEGPELPVARYLARDLGVEEDVYFMGKQSEIACILSMSSVMLLPSEKESFGLVAIEAMACGTPVVGSTAGGIPEVVEHGKTGFLTEVGNVPEMIHFVNRLLDEPDLHERMAAAGRRRVETHFSVDRQVEEYIRLYMELLEGREKLPNFNEVIV